MIRRESSVEKGRGVQEAAAGGAVTVNSRPHPPPPRQVHPSARLACCRFWAQHLHAGHAGGPARVLEVERSPPLPLPGRVKEHLRQPKYQQACGWEPCASQGWFLSRPWLFAGTSSPAWRGKGDPHSWVPSAPPNRRMGSSVASTGGLSPWTPTWPLSHLVQGCRPQSRTEPWRTGLARQMGRGGIGRLSLWHLQG